MIRRREFIAGLGGAATWALAARAQQSSKVYSVAWVSASEPVADMNESSGDRNRWQPFLLGQFNDDSSVGVTLLPAALSSQARR